MPTLASSFPMRSSSDSTKTQNRRCHLGFSCSPWNCRSGPGLADDIMYVVPENIFSVSRIKFATNRRGL